MESTSTTMRYIIPTNVRRVYQHKHKKWVGGHGDEAKFIEIPEGWFVVFNDSFEALHVGSDKPDLEVGDRVIITIEKERAEANAKFVKAPEQ